jgi:autotransporter adhesin
MITYLPGSTEGANITVDTSMFVRKGLQLDMNDQKIINTKEGINENDVCTMKNLSTSLTLANRTMETKFTEMRNNNLQKGNDIDMQNKRITNLANGSSSNDAVTLGQFEAVVARLAPSTTSALESLDKYNMNNQRITNVANGVAETDAVAMRQLGNLTTNLNMNNNKITNLQNGTDDSDAVTMGQLNSSRSSMRREIDACVPTIEKYKMRNNIDMYNKNINNLANGVADNDAATLSQVKNAEANLNMNSHKIENLAAGTNDNDAVNKLQLNDYALNSEKNYFQNHIVMNNHQIRNLARGIDDNDAANMRNVYTMINNKFAPSLDMSNNKIINVAAPTENNDAARYIDIFSIFKNFIKVKNSTLNFTPTNLTQKIIQFNQQIMLQPLKIIPISLYIYKGGRWNLEPFYIQGQSIYFTAPAYNNINACDYHFIYLLHVPSMMGRALHLSWIK